MYEEVNTSVKTDVYKLGHMEQFKDGTTGVYAYLCARSDKYFQECVFFGLQYSTDALEHENMKPDELFLPYFPYARQDRYTSPGVSFSLKIAAKLINDLNYKKVTIYEPHSDVTPALVNNCNIRTSDVEALCFVDPIFDGHPILVVAPDIGATKRVSRFLDYCAKVDCKKVILDDMGIGFKKRDPATGRLKYTGFTDNINHHPILMLDDLCDGGATFNALSEIIDTTGTKMGYPKYLFVAHGIFSKGFDVLTDTFENVGTTDSFPNEREMPKNFIVYNL